MRGAEPHATFPGWLEGVSTFKKRGAYNDEQEAMQTNRKGPQMTNIIKNQLKIVPIRIQRYEQSVCVFVSMYLTNRQILISNECNNLTLTLA